MDVVLALARWDDQGLENHLDVREVLEDRLLGSVGHALVFRFIVPRGAPVLRAVRAVELKTFSELTSIR